MLMMFNLDIEARLIEKLIDLADQAVRPPRLAYRPRLGRALSRPPPPSSGDGTIDYAEFAQIMTAEDLKAFDLAKLGLIKEVKVFRKGPPVLRPGVTAAEIRDAQQTIKSRINTKCAPHRHARRLPRDPRRSTAHRPSASAHLPPGTATSSALLPRDRRRRLGKADRAEVLRLIKIYAPSSRDEVLENVVDFGDYDGEGEVRAAAAPRRPAAAIAPRPRACLSRPTAAAYPQVSFAEFARVVTTDDILNMKKTLSAVEVKTNKYGEVEEAVDHRRRSTSSGKWSVSSSGTRLRIPTTE